MKHSSSCHRVITSYTIPSLFHVKHHNLVKNSKYNSRDWCEYINESDNNNRCDGDTKQAWNSEMHRLAQYKHLLINTHRGKSQRRQQNVVQLQKEQKLIFF